MLPKKYNFRESEAKWQSYWEAEGVYKFNLEASGPVYSIDTPPPTVSGSIHIGHVYSYTQAEIIARFWRMNGYRVFYPFGFDDNGLPTERLVEKEKGIRAHEISREDFTRFCLETTDRYEVEFKNLWQGLGFSVDWELEYSTIDEKSRRISQLSFIELYNKGRVYQGKRPVLWCGNCQTSIVQAEVEVIEEDTKFNYLRFETDRGKDITVATTRPELLPACVAIFINPEDQKNSSFIGGKARVPIFNNEVPIIGDEAVEMDLGSGIVMCCTFGDQQDIKWWQQYNLPLRKIIDREGRIADAVPDYGGLDILVARKKIIKKLEMRGLLLKQENLQHHVAIHERCNSLIEFLSSKQWYLRIMDKKEELLKAGEQINWYPSYMKQRYFQWVENLQWDWCISRQRYFGVPFPLWYCKDCGRIILADQKDLPINPLKDKPARTCQCGSSDFKPEKDVMDTWATSSLTPLINAHWQGGKETEYPIIPMNLRPQAHDIIRTWTFYTIVKSLYHYEEIPWKDIMISGFVMAGESEKISKSKGNANNTPNELIKSYSADVLRLWAASSAKLGTDIVFSEEELKNNRKTLVKLWNAARFSLGHLTDFSLVKNIKYELMDRWILQRMKIVQNTATGHLREYEINQAKRETDNFFWSDFCDNYLEIIKDRLYKPDKRGKEAGLSARQTLYQVLLGILKMYAIFMPHITEEIYQNYFYEMEAQPSIHLLDWDCYPGFEPEEELLQAGNDLLVLLGMVRKYKTDRGLSLGEGLAQLVIKYPENRNTLFPDALADLQAASRAEKIFIESHEGSEPGIKL